MPLVVSNSSPIINLAIIGKLELLHTFWGTIIVPEAVWKETVIDGDSNQEVERIKEAGWINVEKVEDRNFVLALENTLDKGEAEAIALAIEKGADIILLDETDARDAADVFKIRKTGVLGILIRAKMENKIPSLKKEIDNLRDKANFWLKESLIESALRAVGE